MDRQPPHRRPPAARPPAETILHNLYVKVVAAGDAPDDKSRAVTLEVLQYISTRLPVLARMGVEIKVNKIRGQDLQNPRLLEVMRKRGISHLPALVTSSDVYMGVNNICEVYEQNVREFEAVDRREPSPPPPPPPGGGADSDDELRSYYKKGLMGGDERDRDDSDVDEAMGESGGKSSTSSMMDAYHRGIERRKIAAPPRPPAGRRQSPPAESRRPAEGRRPAAAPAPAPPGRLPAPADADDADIQDTIASLASNINDDMRRLALPAAGGGGGGDDDGGADLQDDLMERAYWNNKSDLS